MIDQGRTTLKATIRPIEPPGLDAIRAQAAEDMIRLFDAADAAQESTAPIQVAEFEC